MAKGISLTQGKVAVVDDEDYERVARFKWHATKIGKNWYAARRVYQSKQKTKTIYMHRFIIRAPKGKVVDHKNHHGLDNRRCNLRVCTTAQNVQNQRVNPNSGTSEYKGVSWCSKTSQWRACAGGEHIGFFDNEVTAAKAYNKAARKKFGEFANVNIINDRE